MNFPLKEPPVSCHVSEKEGSDFRNGSCFSETIALLMPFLHSAARLGRSFRRRHAFTSQMNKLQKDDPRNEESFTHAVNVFVPCCSGDPGRKPGITNRFLRSEVDPWIPDLPSSLVIDVHFTLSFFRWVLVLSADGNIFRYFFWVKQLNFAALH